MLESADDNENDNESPSMEDSHIAHLNAKIKSSSETMTDETVADRICSAVQKACRNDDTHGIMNIYQLHASSSTVVHVPGSVLSRCNLNGIVNACLGIEGVEGGVVSFRDSSIIKSAVTDSETKTGEDRRLKY